MNYLPTLASDTFTRMIKLKKRLWWVKEQGEMKCFFSYEQLEY